MPSYENNLYYNPKASGLEIVDQVDYSSGCYEFDTRVVWWDEKNKKLITAHDSGCSCPVPFEDVNVDDCEDITDTYSSFLINEYKERTKNGRNDGVTRDDIDSMVELCRKAKES